MHVDVEVDKVVVVAMGFVWGRVGWWRDGRYVVWCRKVWGVGRGDVSGVDRYIGGEVGIGDDLGVELEVGGEFYY